MNQCRKPTQKWSKDVKSDNYCYRKVGRAILEQGRKRPLDTPKRMIERREREGEREKER